MRTALVLVLLTIPARVSAQEPVNKWADWISWGTASVNPTWGAIEAARSERPKCHLAQLALSSGLGFGTALTLQRIIQSPRPCCAGNGMPSAHTTMSAIGLMHGVPDRGFSLKFAIGVGSMGTTASLRTVANRHTNPQVAWGMLLGLGSELAGQLIPCGA